jgi:hypothetical protein
MHGQGPRTGAECSSTRPGTESPAAPTSRQSRARPFEDSNSIFDWRRSSCGPSS